MKLALLLLLSSLPAFSQVKPTIEVTVEDVESLEEVRDLGMSEEDIQVMINQSKQQVSDLYDIDHKNELKVLSIEVKDTKTKLVNTDKDIEIKVDPPKGILFITWGYNRGFHTNSDITIETEDGKFTIKDAVGVDRPSKFSLEYLKPSKFSIPQYNLKVGYWFSEDSKFGIAGGTDHMKWIFDEQQEYDIEGYFNKPLWVNGEKKNFNEIIEGRNASFLMLEHSDGYNYPYLEGLYREKLINTTRFGLDVVAGAGAGILFPKTRTRIADRENSAQYRDVDNKFHVAGWGAHSDLSIMFKYKQNNGVTFFVKPTARSVVGKINNALYMGSDEGRISQTAIYTFEPSVSIGSEVPFKTFSKRNKRLDKMKKQAEQEDRELTLEEYAKQNPN